MLGTSTAITNEIFTVGKNMLCYQSVSDSEQRSREQPSAARVRLRQLEQSAIMRLPRRCRGSYLSFESTPWHDTAMSSTLRLPLPRRSSRTVL